MPQHQHTSQHPQGRLPIAHVCCSISKHTTNVTTRPPLCRCVLQVDEDGWEEVAQEEEEDFEEQQADGDGMDYDDATPAQQQQPQHHGHSRRQQQQQSKPSKQGHTRSSSGKEQRQERVSVLKRLGTDGS